MCVFYISLCLLICLQIPKTGLLFDPAMVANTLGFVLPHLQLAGNLFCTEVSTKTCNFTDWISLGDIGTGWQP